MTREGGRTALRSEGYINGRGMALRIFLYKDTTITGLDTCIAYGRSFEYYTSSRGTELAHCLQTSSPSFAWSDFLRQYMLIL